MLQRASILAMRAVLLLLCIVLSTQAFVVPSCSRFSSSSPSTRRLPKGRDGVKMMLLPPEAPQSFLSSSVGLMVRVCCAFVVLRGMGVKFRRTLLRSFVVGRMQICWLYVWLFASTRTAEGWKALEKDGRLVSLHQSHHPWSAMTACTFPHPDPYCVPLSLFHTGCCVPFRQGRAFHFDRHGRRGR